MKTFYTYLWLREDGTPYYVGKGSGNRAFVQRRHSFPMPSLDRILVQEFPDENSAFAAEVFLIAFYGREDSGKGCLLNLTDGGENPPLKKKGCKGPSDEVRKKISETLKMKGIKPPSRLGLSSRGGIKGRKCKPLSAERRGQISERNKGNSYHKGHKHSEEAKKKMSDSAKLREKKTHCVKGHERIPENLYSNGICKACQKEKNDNRPRKREAHV